MKVYISGKIGEEVISPATKQKVDKAEHRLRELGYDVFNPTCPDFQYYVNICVGHNNKYNQCLLLCITELQKCDIIVLLPDWHDSPGAKAELAFAQACGIPVKELMSYGTLADWGNQDKH